jgi:hypothetical protein
MVISGGLFEAGCDVAELLELADPVGPIRFDTTSEPMRKKSRPKAASAIRYLKTSGEAKRRSALPAISHDAHAHKAQDHHRPRGGLGDRRDLRRDGRHCAGKVT